MKNKEFSIQVVSPSTIADTKEVSKRNITRLWLAFYRYTANNIRKIPESNRRKNISELFNYTLDYMRPDEFAALKGEELVEKISEATHRGNKKDPEYKKEYDLAYGALTGSKLKSLEAFVAAIEDKHPLCKEPYEILSSVIEYNKVLGNEDVYSVFTQLAFDIHVLTKLYGSYVLNQFNDVTKLFEERTENGWVNFQEFISDVLRFDLPTKQEFLMDVTKDYDGKRITQHFPPSKFYEYFLNSKTVSVETFEEVYFQSKFNSKFTVADFKQTKEIEIISNVVNNSIKQKETGTNIMLYGLPGTGKTELSYALAKANGWKLISVGQIPDDEGIFSAIEHNPSSRKHNLRVALRIFKNTPNVVILFDEAEDAWKDNDSQSKSGMNNLAEQTTVPIIWTTNSIQVMEQSFLRRMSVAMRFEVLEQGDKKEMFVKQLNENGIVFDDDTIKRFTKYDLVPSIIEKVVSTIKTCSLNEEDSENVIKGLTELYNYGNEQVIKEDNLRFDNEYKFEFANTDTDLERIAERLISANLKQWSLCLHGAPGTGKSALGRHLAKQMGLKVIQKRASDILGMYVGDNEANIRKAFKEAESEGALLIFDEADSLLQSRGSAVRSWEVSSVNEMLTQMEAATIPFICTTNILDSIDEAALRRFTFKVKFDYMTQEQIQAAIKEYLKVDIRPPHQWKLSTGDIMNVAKKCNILGLTDKDSVWSELEMEAKLKSGGSNAIGFSV